MIMRKFATTLRDLVVKEISLVDRPANPHALVTLYKRDEGPDPALVQVLLKSIQSIYEDDATKAEKNAALRETLVQYTEVTSRDGLTDIAAITKRSLHSDPLENELPGVRGAAPKPDPLSFNAGGRGPTHDKLWVIFDNYRREMGPFAGSAAFNAAWSDLSDDEKDEIRNEEEATDRARAAEADKRSAAAAKEKEMMNKSQLADVAKRVIAGHDDATTRDDIVTAARKIAIADRAQGETIEKALGRFWESPAGRDVYHAMQLAKVEIVDPPAAIELGPAMRALHKRADEIRLGKSMTREQAVEKIATDPAEARFWNAARAEERERVLFR